VLLSLHESLVILGCDNILHHDLAVILGSGHHSVLLRLRTLG
jgi:hypothetical protein